MKERQPNSETNLNLTLPAEKGSARFSLKRALMGAAIGAIALPLAAFGTVYLTGGLSDISSGLPIYLKLAVLQSTTGAVLGAVATAWRR